MGLRDRKKTGESLSLIGVGVKEMAELETRIMENTKFLTKKKGNLHEYFADEYDPVTNERSENQLAVEVKSPDDIKTVTNMFEALAEDDTPVAYSRVFLAENGNPNVDQIDAFANAVRANEGSMVFVDSDGGNRVTMAQVLALLVTGQEAAAAEGDGEEEAEEAPEGDEGDEGAAKKEKKEVKEYNPDEPDFEAGEFSLVMKLVSKLNGEETEAEKQEREAAEEAAKEEAVAECRRKYEEDQKAKEEAAAAAAEPEAEAAAPEGAEGEAAEAEKPAETEAPAAEGGDEGDAPAEAEGGEEEKPAEKTLDELIEEAKAAVPTGPPAVSTDGTDAKKRADAAFDKASACGNLRSKIVELKTTYEESQDKAVLESAREKLQAYVNVILFCTYLKAYAANPPGEAPEPEEGEEPAAPQGLTFKDFRENMAEVIMNIGSTASGEISEFFWE
jgi:hypothetical protein